MGNKIDEEERSINERIKDAIKNTKITIVISQNPKYKSISKIWIQCESSAFAKMAEKELYYLIFVECFKEDDYGLRIEFWQPYYKEISKNYFKIIGGKLVDENKDVIEFSFSREQILLFLNQYLSMNYDYGFTLHTSYGFYKSDGECVFQSYYLPGTNLLRNCNEIT